MTTRGTILLLAILGLGAALLAGRPATVSQTPARGAAAAPGEFGTPAIALDRTQKDLGMLPAGSLHSVHFSVRNTGSRRLVIRRDSCESCGLASDQTSLIVPPGESREIHLLLDTSGMAGAVSHVVEYSNSDPACPRFSLTVTANVAAG